MNMQRVYKWAVGLLALVGAVYLTLVGLDFVVGWSLYGYFFRGLSSYGVPDYLGGILAVWLAVAVVWFGPAITMSIFMRRKDWIWKVALGISIWLGIMYAVSYPYSDGLFNPFTGKARFRYSTTSSGEIRKFPMGFNSDPDFGLPLKDFDSRAAEEYHKQGAGGGAVKSQTKRSEGGSWPWWFSGKIAVNSDRKLEAIVEAVRFDSYQTIVEVAVKSKLSDGAYLYPAGKYEAVASGGTRVVSVRDDPSSTYLVDDVGQTYNLTKESGEYALIEGVSCGLFSSNNCFYIRRLIRREEVYRLSLIFPAVKRDISKLKLHYVDFGFLELNDFL